MPGPREAFAESEELYARVVAQAGKVFTETPDVITTDRRGRVDGAWAITISGPWQSIERRRGMVGGPEADPPPESQWALLETLVRLYSEHPAASTALRKPDDRFPLMVELHLEDED